MALQIESTASKGVKGLVPGEKKEISYRWKDKDIRRNALRIIILCGGHVGMAHHFGHTLDGNISREQEDSKRMAGQIVGQILFFTPLGTSTLVKMLLSLFRICFYFQNPVRRRKCLWVHS